MPQTEIPEYVNERPRPGPKNHSNTNPGERRTIQLVAFSFGALCVIQAVLNVSLRLTLHYGKSSAYSDCNATHRGDGDQTEMDRCNGLIAALKTDRERLEKQNKELTSMIQMREEERDRLKLQLGELSAGGSSSSQCPAGWRLINSRCYFLSGESDTWAGSRASCRRLRADLVVISNEQEQRALYRMNGEEVLLFWMGLRKVEGDFQWVDGSALTNQYWQPDQPNPADNEDCVESYHLHNELNTWNDVACDKRQRWLCEKGL